MAKCFVAHPFDGGEFDKRFRQVYEPAIQAAGLKPYRVDRDPNVSIVIDTIVSEIRSCSTFFVDVSVDNPNVWFELGLAIAFGQEVCIVCAERRERFPFDIQHRRIIRYKTDAPDDFTKLQGEITARLQAIQEKQKTVESVEEKISETTVETTGLSDLEVICLGLLASEVQLNSSTSTYRLYSEMEKAGYLPIATSVALRRLSIAEFIKEEFLEDENGESYRAAGITTKGWQWIDENLGKFKLKKPARKAKVADPMDEEIPF
jgi:hypothetical protein